MSISTAKSNVRPSVGSERSLQMALAVARAAAENRGRNIVVLDLRKITPIFDYFVIATGASRRQLHAMSEEIDRLLEVDLNDKRLGIEGYRESRWIVLDYGNIVVHLFDEETRDYYALEQLWGDAPRVALPELNNGQSNGANESPLAVSEAECRALKTRLPAISSKLDRAALPPGRCRPIARHSRGPRCLCRAV